MDLKLIMRFLFFLVAILHVNTMNAQVKIPDILSNLKKDHPRILVKSYKDFDDLKDRIATSEFLKKSESVLRNKAEKMLQDSLTKYTLVPSKYLLIVARNVLDKSYTLSMMYRLTGDNKYKDRLWDELLNVSQFPDWDAEHFLGNAELTHAFAIAYDWLYDVWSPEQKRIIKNTIMDKGLSQGFLYYNNLAKGFNWANVEHNWNQVCNGSMAIGALAIADEEPKFCENVLKNALKRVPLAMKHYGPDGGWNEGPMYISYALKYNVALIAALESAVGSDFGLSSMQGFSKTGSFVIGMSGATGNTFNYADAFPRVVNMPEMFWLANKFNQPQLINYQTKWSQHDFPVEMLWYKEAKKTDDMPLSNYFRISEAATLRSSWRDTTAWYVGFKAGNNAVNHGHLDLGSFVLEKNAKRWVVDLGGDSYNLPGYFSSNPQVKKSKRWIYYRMATEGHNTLVIKDGEDANQNTLADTKIGKFVDSKDKSFGIMDLSSAYTPYADSVKRGIALVDEKRVVIQDEILNTKPIDLYWMIHTPASITLSVDKKTATLKIDNEFLKVEIQNPTRGTFEIWGAEPKLNEPLSKGNIKNTGIKRLVIHLENSFNESIVVVFKDVDDNNKVINKSLKDW